jgi:membrane protein DedA with SNARE-associated domain
LSLTTLATNLIAALGYGGLAAGLVVDSAGLPIPSEVLLPLSGALARQGRFSLAAVIAVGALAQTAGAILAYQLGRHGGLPLVERYGKYVLFSTRELAQTEKAFAKHGQWLTLFGRVVPVVRTYIGYPAGIARMPFGRFVTASFIGSAVWSAVLAILGYRLADSFGVIDAVVRKFSILIVGLLAGLAVWYVIRHLRKN